MVEGKALRLPGHKTAVKQACMLGIRWPGRSKVECACVHRLAATRVYFLCAVPLHPSRVNRGLIGFKFRVVVRVPPLGGLVALSLSLSCACANGGQVVVDVDLTCASLSRLLSRPSLPFPVPWPSLS